MVCTPEPGEKTRLENAGRKTHQQGTGRPRTPAVTLCETRTDRRARGRQTEHNTDDLQPGVSSAASAPTARDWDGQRPCHEGSGQAPASTSNKCHSNGNRGFKVSSQQPHWDCLHFCSSLTRWPLSQWPGGCGPRLTLCPRTRRWAGQHRESVGEAGVCKRQREGWRVEEASQERTRHRGVPGTERRHSPETLNSTWDHEGPSSFPRVARVVPAGSLHKSGSPELRRSRMQRGVGHGPGGH